MFSSLAVPNFRLYFTGQAICLFPRPEGRSFVVVARDPDDGSTEPLGDGFDGLPQRGVRLGLAEVGEITREHDRVGSYARALHCGEGRVQVRRGVEAAAEGAIAGEQMRIAHVHDRARGGWVLTERDLGHAFSLSRGADARQRTTMR